MIAGGESLTVEFKSDRARVSDRALVEAVACLANAKGGHLLIGVEDDCTVTGAQPRHSPATDPVRMQALIANMTLPPLPAVVELCAIDGRDVIVITVEASTTPISTSSGTYTRRALQTDGRPQCVPYPFHEMLARRVAVGEADYAALEIPGATIDDLDPGELERFRTLVRRSGGDRGLAELADEDLVRALGVATVGHTVAEPLAGALLLFGRPDPLRRFIPTHASAFQVLRGTSIETNAEIVGGLLRCAEELHTAITAHNAEEEIDAGLLRIAVPLVPPEAIREVVANALVHRDYTRLGPVQVQLTDDALTVTNPGGFPEGVTLATFLRESRPRSPLLAAAFSRAGLVDRTGRGINRMYESTLRIGRRAPDYTRSSDVAVVASFALGRADTVLARFVLQREAETSRPIRLADLQVLHRLRNGGGLSVAEAAALLQEAESVTRTTMARMVTEGLVEERGTGRGRRYHLSAAVFRALDARAAYVRIRRFDPIQQEQMVLSFVRAHGRIRRSEAADLCALSSEQASRLLRQMAGRGLLRMVGSRRGAAYTLP